mmetsp:Transcript_32324/g.48152  ORF Transcript_32324/g.48152 Transcript_32324/m.48152 type:complete len:271 (+) Transcript_32324:13-825(+)
MIEVRTLPGRGKGIVAVRPIQKHTLILSEQPFFRHHLGRHGTSSGLATAFVELVMGIDDEVLHKMAELCGGEDLMAQLCGGGEAYKTEDQETALHSDDRCTATTLPKAADDEDNDKDGEEDDDDDEDVSEAALAFSAKVLSVFNVCQRNAFGGKAADEECNAVQGAVQDGSAAVPCADPTPPGEERIQRQKGSYLYSTSCLFNHSCDPNASHRVDADGQIHVCARRDVQVGEEVTIAYVNIEDARDIRREHLRDRYEFECACARCADVVE